jgi:peptide/nickel transport system substrate-binding protein
VGKASWWLGLGALVAVSAVLGAGSASGALPPIREGGTLRVNISNDTVASLDPAIAYDTAGWTVESAICANLVNYPDSGGAGAHPVLPEVAASLPTVADGGRTYVFTVRPGFRFSTGEAVTAANFAAAINRDLAPAMRSPAAAFLGDVVGAAQVLSGTAGTASGVSAVGNTLTVQLVRPAPDFVTRMAMPFFCAVPTGLPAVPQGFQPIPTAGPYYIASATPNTSIVLEQNPHYGGSRPRHLSEIDVNLRSEQNASILQIARGNADYDAGTLEASLLRSYEARGKLGTADLSVHPDMELHYLVFNTRRPLFRGARLRRAVNFALDRRRILAVSGLYGRPTDQILPPAMPGYKPFALYPLDAPDLARARQLAGHQQRAAILAVSGPLTDDYIANEVADELGRIGITVQITYPSSITRAGAWDIAIYDWTADYADPYDFINVLLDGRIRNSEDLGGFDNRSFDTRMATAATLAGPARYTAYSNLDAALMRSEAPIAPLADVYQPELTSSHVNIDCEFFSPQHAGLLDLVTTCLR